MERIEFARELRRRATDAELALWRHLRGRQLLGHKFRRQEPICEFIVDFVCREAMVIVEIDGGIMRRLRTATASVRMFWRRAGMLWRDSRMPRC